MNGALSSLKEPRVLGFSVHGTSEQSEIEIEILTERFKS
jgi:hypothetical protein